MLYPYSADVSDGEWAFLASYLTLMRDDTPQRQHELREIFTGFRSIARTGLPWRYMPNNLPPQHTGYQLPGAWPAIRNAWPRFCRAFI